MLGSYIQISTYFMNLAEDTTFIIEDGELQHWVISLSLSAPLKRRNSSTSLRIDYFLRKGGQTECRCMDL